MTPDASAALPHSANPREYAPSVPTRVAIFRSWKSMKPWVMIWIWAVNLVYLAAFFWLDQPEARAALIAYVAVGPCALAIMIPQRGLTRLSGVMHLPFLILLVWLTPRVFAADHGGAFGLWLAVLWGMTVICVAFDILDVLRWFRGETYRLGTPQAVDHGASQSAPIT